MLGHTSPECDGDNNQGCAQYFAAGPKPCAVFGVLEHGLLSSQWQRVFRARYVLWQASSALLMAMCEMGGGGHFETMAMYVRMYNTHSALVVYYQHP